MINQYLLSKLSEKNQKIVLDKKGDKLVYIDSIRGLWRPGAKGYTDKREEAWVLTLREAFEQTKTCGPEKKIVFPYVVDIPEEFPLSCEEKLMKSTVIGDVPEIWHNDDKNL